MLTKSFLDIPILHLENYIESIRNTLKPPVGNKLLYGNNIKIMVVAGPNERSDYHVNMGEELFFQLHGDILLNLVVNNSRIVQTIPEGHMFLLPAGIKINISSLCCLS